MAQEIAEKITFTLDITEEVLQDYNESLFMEKFKKDGKIPLNKETATEIVSFILSKDWDFPVESVKAYFKIQEE